jgi:hypothetical protein
MMSGSGWIIAAMVMMVLVMCGLMMGGIGILGRRRSRSTRRGEPT